MKLLSHTSEYFKYNSWVDPYQTSFHLVLIYLFCSIYLFKYIEFSIYYKIEVGVGFSFQLQSVQEDFYPYVLHRRTIFVGQISVATALYRQHKSIALDEIVDSIVMDQLDINHHNLLWSNQASIITSYTDETTELFLATTLQRWQTTIIFSFIKCHKTCK